LFFGKIFDSFLRSEVQILYAPIYVFFFYVMRRVCQTIAQGIGNFFAAAHNNKCAFFASIEVSSKIICPVFTLATQWSTFPFPLPIRTSFGFFVTGISGMTRIHKNSRFFKPREICRRAASS
jgi:hypothetical protein